MVAKKHQDRLKDLKSKVENSHDYFKSNFERFKFFKYFVFKSALSDDDLTRLQNLGKPPFEFNTLESFISRQMGEFSEHDPNLTVCASDGLPLYLINDRFNEMLEIVEGHFREILHNVNTDNLEQEIFKDTMSAGFSVAKVYTDYVNNMSFEQNIYVDRVFDPTMCGFDPMARDSHKGDGNYCFEIVPYTRERFEREFGEEKAKNINFSRDVEGFNWSYKNENIEIVLIVDFFEKKYKREKIYLLSNGQTIKAKHYDDVVAEFSQKYEMEQPPIVIDERMTDICSIVRYRLCESEVLKYDETDFSHLPMIFFDGNSVYVEGENQQQVQMTKPYVYQAKDMQRLKNFAGQTVASEIETMVQHKFMAALESIPDEYIDAYKNPQEAQVLVYRAFHENDPNKPLPPPQAVPRVDTPQIVLETFAGLDTITQNILGNYDAQQGNIENQNLSGKAIEAGAMQSSAAAKPYLMNYVRGLQRLGQIIIDLIPKYYVTPRSLPVRNSDGKRDVKIINNNYDADSIFLNYQPESLQVKVEIGVNSEMQKRTALNQIINMMQASEIFSQFINTEGLDLLLQNLDIRGISELRKKANDFVEQLKEQQAQQPEQPDPAQQMIESNERVEMAKTEQRREEAQAKHMRDTAELAIKQEKVNIEKRQADIDFYEMVQNQRRKDRELWLKGEKIDAETARTAIDASMDFAQDIID